MLLDAHQNAGWEFVRIHRAIQGPLDTGSFRVCFGGITEQICAVAPSYRQFFTQIRCFSDSISYWRDNIGGASPANKIITNITKKTIIQQPALRQLL
ncbi:hypothetical protein [Chitinophaga sp. XS-30]|uniref:hypothetical protein n=1 Tax=Chitinophaga sp. XS-30 TaxID=2604421 RepID=UPI0011DE4E27|nr:hypothetical protein [Chitinophaga sp. XS-30]QEH39756.1 hypothetical protein FW415_02305 [Chitinophaga sp. XS-30]